MYILLESLSKEFIFFKMNFHGIDFLVLEVPTGFLTRIDCYVN